MPNKELYISSGLIETRAAIKQNDVVVEVHYMRKDNKACLGNIYIGKVMNVLPGMAAAFVDIGLEKNAFLAEEDLRGNLYIADTKRGDHVLKEGRDILVQIKKEADGTKGAKVSMDVTLAGKYAVLTPFSTGIHVSGKINNQNRISMLRKTYSRVWKKLWKQDAPGVIIRTASQEANDAEIEHDLCFLQKRYWSMQQKLQGCKVPSCVDADQDLLTKAYREWIDRDTQKIYCDDKTLCDALHEVFMGSGQNPYARISLFDRDYDMFCFFNIQREIDVALGRTVHLKSGGYLVFDTTEAMTVVDVNSGKYTGKKEFEDTAFLINQEAAKEIARQLRMRNISGMILIDFINMRDAEKNRQLVETLGVYIQQDVIQCVIVGMTKLGLLEMTRKKSGLPLASVVNQTCFRCGGSGRLDNLGSILADIERKVKLALREGMPRQGMLGEEIADEGKVVVNVHSSVAAYVLEQGKKSLEQLEAFYQVKIVLD